MDLLPPGRHDPDRVHEAIWREVAGDDAAEDATGEYPPAEPVTLGTFDAGPR